VITLYFVTIKKTSTKDISICKKSCGTISFCLILTFNIFPKKKKKKINKENSKYYAQ
jgi:hypothetical protein